MVHLGSNTLNIYQLYEWIVMVNMIAFQNGRTVERINYLLNSAEERKAYQRREYRIKLSIWCVICLEALIGAFYTYFGYTMKS